VKKQFLASLAAAALGTFFAAEAEASCIPLPPAQQRARADVIFDGVALESATASGVQRFRVVQYLKGRGPRIVRVSTGNIRRADGSTSVTTVSLIVRRGQRWRIFARRGTGGILRTSVCAGSRRQ
jgi:hypothetical protein